MDYKKMWEELYDAVTDMMDDGKDELTGETGEYDKAYLNGSVDALCDVLDTMECIRTNEEKGVY